MILSKTASVSGGATFGTKCVESDSNARASAVSVRITRGERGICIGGTRSPQ